MHYDFTWRQITGLFVLAIPIACVARTVVFEEVFREPREWCKRRSQSCNHLLNRKFFYLFTCEYCFSHYVALLFMFLCGYKLMFTDWKGYLIGFFSLVFVANIYLNLYSRLRVDITTQKKEIEVKEKEIALSEKRLDLAEDEGDSNNSSVRHSPGGAARDDLPTHL